MAGTGYPAMWQEIATGIKAEAGWACIRCKRPHSPSEGYTLTVHHLDMVKSNCERWNLVALCQRCHLKIQSRVVMDQAIMFMPSTWIMPYIAGFYMSSREDKQDDVELQAWIYEYEFDIGPWPDWAPKPEEA